MSLTEELITNDRIECLHDNNVIPDHNLVYNIDHMIGFIELDLIYWQSHSERLEGELTDVSDIYRSGVLLKETNVRVFLKVLFNVVTCYIAAFDALEQLLHQLQRLNVHCNARISKPKLDKKNELYLRAKYIRNFSYIHQYSKNETCPLNRSAAMNWNIVISKPIEQVSNCDCYSFGEWGVKSESGESNLDIGVINLRTFIGDLLFQLNKAKEDLVCFNREIKT
ncbi:hypothetical protein [Photobacterium swingsii]|uniref:hypothetical protein n=1 Tax=Photobacterium swingsii TaxID=680026 RepID=UPI0040694F51